MARRPLPALRALARGFAGPARDLLPSGPPFYASDFFEYLNDESYRRFGKGCRGDQPPHGDCEQAHGINTANAVEAALKELAQGKGRTATLARKCAKAWEQDEDGSAEISEPCADLMLKVVPTAAYLAARDMEAEGYDMGLARGAAEVDWRPQVTIPEDYYALAWTGALVGGALLLRALFARPATPPGGS